MSTELKEVNYNAVDLMKWIMAAVVVLLHSNYVAVLIMQNAGSNFNIGVIVRVIGKSAVPFFLITAAFMMARRFDWNATDGSNYRIVSKNAARIFEMYLVWTLLYFPISVIGYMTKGLDFHDSLWESIVNAFLGGSYISIQLWYLLALAISLTIIAAILKKGTEKRMWLLFLMALGFYALYIYTQEFPVVTEDKLFQVQMTLFMIEIFSTPFYCVIGIYMAKYEEKMRKAFRCLPIQIFLILGLGLLTYWTNIMRSNWSYLPTVLLHIVFTGTIITLVIGKKGSRCFQIFRKMSTYVYLIHMVFYFIVSLFIPEESYLIRFALVLVISNVFAYGYIAVVHKIRLKKGVERLKCYHISA